MNAIKGPGLTPDELQAIKERWGLADKQQPHAYVEFDQARSDIGMLIREVEREWQMPWKMRDAKAPRA
jgi:hypothetical protein